MPNKYAGHHEVADTRTLKPDVHPIWRGIGFGLVIITPIMAYYAAMLVLQYNAQNRWVSIPKELIMKNVSDPLILVKAILVVVFIFILAAIFSAITFFLYSMIVPTKYGPLDVPNVKYRGKNYKR